MTQERDNWRLEKFLLAKRSIKMWPIEGDTDQKLSHPVDGFLKDGMRIKQDDLDTIVIESIERVRTSPRSKHHHTGCLLDIATPLKSFY